MMNFELNSLFNILNLRKMARPRKNTAQPENTTAVEQKPSRQIRRRAKVVRKPRVARSISQVASINSNTKFSVNITDKIQVAGTAMKVEFTDSCIKLYLKND